MAPKKPTWPPSRVFVQLHTCGGENSLGTVFGDMKTADKITKIDLRVIPGVKTRIQEYRLVTPRKPAKATAKKAKRRAVRRAP